MLFTIDLAQILGITMNYADATTEYTRWLAQNPTQLAFVQNKMAAYTGRGEAREDAIAVVLAGLKRNDSVQLYQLLGWLYLEGKRFSDAFDVYRKIDVLTNSRGAEIYAFADRAFKERSFDVAAQAYQLAINTPVSSARLPYAKFGYALSLKELESVADTLAGLSPAGTFPESEAQISYRGAVAYFRQIISEYPRSEFSARSYYQIGTIQFQKYFDLDGALASFEQVEREIPGLNTIHFDVALRIGEILTAKGDTAKAAVRFLRVITAPNATPDQQDEAHFRVAELYYFRGRFQEAVRELAQISLNLKADFTNDALVLQTFLQENAVMTDTPLQEFARADFLARQRKNTEAILLFQRVISQFPEALLVDEALMKIASLQIQARLYADAVATFERFLTEFKDNSIMLDKAQFGLGEVYERGLDDKAKALAAYEKLLADYPQSLLVTRARKRIRELRGESL
jgi:tetratricopeptide (TPR) repeat protein